MNEEKKLELRIYNPPGFPNKHVLNRVTPYSKLSGQRESNKIELFRRWGKKIFPLFYAYELWDSEGYVLICRIVDENVKQKSVKRYIRSLLPLASVLQPNVQIEIKRAGLNE